MRHVIYSSSSVKALDSKDLDDLAAGAQANNKAENITGLLLYGDRSFFQVFEGPAENIVAMKKRIWKDRRHSGIMTLRDREVDERIFSDWSMGCYRVDCGTTSSARWPIIDLQSIADHLPEEATPEITVLAKTFFTSIVPRG